MTTNKKVLIIVLSLIVATIITTSDKFGLAGTWYDKVGHNSEYTFNEYTFVIVKSGDGYKVTGVKENGHTVPLISQDWSGNSLQWTFYDTFFDTVHKYETIEVTEDGLHVNMDMGGEDFVTHYLTRVP